MAKKVLSIVIGTEYTKVCEASYKKNYKNKGVKVYRSISFPTPPGTIEDGFIKDQEAFSEELKSRLRAGKFKSDKVIFSVTSSKIANREVILPPVKDKRIMDIIQTGASDYFPIDMKEYILSYVILEKRISNRQDKARKKKLDRKEKKLAKRRKKLDRKALKRKSKTEIIADNLERMESTQQEQSMNEVNAVKNTYGNGTDNAKKNMRLSVFAAPSTLVKNYYSFAKLMHLDIVALDYFGNSSYQTIKRQAKRGTNVFVQINEKDTLISILREDVLILQRTVGYGLSTLIESVLEQDYYQAKSPEEAMELLCNKNLLTTDPVKKQPLKFDFSWSKGEVAAASEFVQALQTPGKPSMPENEREFYALKNIRESLHFLSNSIARTLDYYKSSHKQIDINTIYLTGMGVHIQGIESFFTAEIGIPHKNMEKLYTFSPKKKAAAYRKNPSEFITCVGAVIKPVDFVPIEFALKRKKRSAVIGTLVFVLTCLAGSVSTVYVSILDYQAAKQELEELNSQYNAMPDLSGAHEEYETEMANLQELQRLEEMTSSHNDDIKDIIEELEKKLPSGTVTNSMQFTETGLTLNITVSDHGVGANAIIAMTIKQLKSIDYFKDNVNVLQSSITEENGISTVALSISCSYAE